MMDYFLKHKKVTPGAQKGRCPGVAGLIPSVPSKYLFVVPILISTNYRFERGVLKVKSWGGGGINLTRSSFQLPLLQRRAVAITRAASRG
jgi:hypothetical protein